MACILCKKEGHTDIHDSGSCVECDKLVCTNPSGRRDGHYHAEDCYCGCGEIVCIRHIKEHSENHNSDIHKCFPELSALYSIKALDLTSKMGTGRTIGISPRTIRHGLETNISDGENFLRYLYLGERIWQDIPRDGFLSYFFRRRFFSRPRGTKALDRIAAVSLNTFVKSINNLRVGVDDFKAVDLTPLGEYGWDYEASRFGKELSDEASNRINYFILYLFNAPYLDLERLSKIEIPEGTPEDKRKWILEG